MPKPDDSIDRGKNKGLPILSKYFDSRIW